MSFKSIFSQISTFLVVIGAIIVAYDAAQYEKEATAREQARCEQLKKIADEMLFWKDDQQAVEFYSKGLKQIADNPTDYSWQFGSHLGFNKKK